MAGDNKGDRSLYSEYNPSKIPAFIFAIAFLLPTFVHLFQVFRYKSWFMISLLFGAAFEVLGYIARIASISNDTSIGIYAASLLLILVAPILFAASIYMALGRLVRELQAEALSPVRSTWMTKIFVAGDIVSFLAQAGGASILSKQTKDAIDLGQKVIVIGLFLQLAFFGFFVYCILIFHKRVRRSPLSTTSIYSAARSTINPMKFFPAIYAASALILVRSIFRVIEYLWRTGPFQKSEVYMYVFDALPMFAMLVYWNFMPAGKFLPNASRGKKIAEEGQELADGREPFRAR